MPTQKSTARLSKKPPLSPEELKQIDAYWRAGRRGKGISRIGHPAFPPYGGIQNSTVMCIEI